MLENIKEICNRVAEDIRGRWAFRQHQAYLKKMGWTEETYQRQTDPRVDKSAGTVDQYYHGYPHVHIYESSIVPPFSRYTEWIECYSLMNQWCKDHCQGAWREDIMRLSKQTALGWDHSETIVYHINEIAGGDSLCYAFENDQDHTLFVLKWA